MSVVEDVAGFRFFAVCDGHAGREAVLSAKKLLPEKLASCLYAGTDVKTAICSAFRATDEELVNLLLQGSSEQEISSGTVVCVGLVNEKNLWIAIHEIAERLLARRTRRKRSRLTTRL